MLVLIKDVASVVLGGSEYKTEILPAEKQRITFSVSLIILLPGDKRVIFSIITTIPRINQTKNKVFEMNDSAAII